MHPRLACPKCGCDDGSKLCGHQEQGVFDGVLWWECWSCGWGWPRDFGEGMERRNSLSRIFADEHNGWQSAGETRRG